MPNTFTSSFIPELWDESIERTLKPALIFADDCTKEFEGKISKLGDTVHILGINAPTITEYKLPTSETTNDSTRRTRNTTNPYGSNPASDLSTPEGIAGYEQTLVIDTVDFFNFELNDIDRVQSMNGLMDAATKEAGLGLANKVDTNLATLIATGATVNSVQNVTVDKTSTTSGGSTTKNVLSKDTVLSYFDEAVQKLYENNVSPATEIIATVSPRFFMKMKQAYTGLDTNNSAMIKNGMVAKYNNVIIKMSNNVAKTNYSGTDGAVDIISFRTRRAVALAYQLNGTETLRSQKSFANIVRGKILYGAKIIRPAELVNLKVAY